MPSARKRNHSIGSIVITPSTSTVNAGNSSDVSPNHTLVPKKARTNAVITNKQPTSSTTVTCTDKDIDMAIDAVIANSQSNSNNNNDNDSSNINSNDLATIGHLQQQVVHLTTVVSYQQQTIARLEKQMRDFLSAFGISMSSSSSPSLSPTVTVSAGDPVAHTDASDGPSLQQKHQTHDNGGQITPQVQPMSFADVVKSSTTRAIRDTVVAAVYIDKAASDRRAASFIISGLPPKPSCQDRDLVVDLCHKELDLQPEVTAIKRLGKPTTGKVQPLLVHVRTTEEARLVTSSARRLRQSTDDQIRQTVFINMNLTRAESKAAYELRCRRRAAAGGRAGGALVAAASAAGQQLNSHSSSSVTALRTVTDSVSSLNTAALPFVPEGTL